MSGSEWIVSGMRHLSKAVESLGEAASDIGVVQDSETQEIMARLCEIRNEVAALKERARVVAGARHSTGG